MCLCTVRDGIKTTVSTAEMQKIPLKKSFNESNTFVYVLLLLLPHQQYLHFDTGCSTHFQLYFPVLDTLVCVCVRLPSIRYTFNFWFMKHSVELVYTQYINTTHIYTLNRYRSICHRHISMATAFLCSSTVCTFLF